MLKNKIIEKILIILLIVIGGKTSAQVRCSHYYGVQHSCPSPFFQPPSVSSPARTERIIPDNQIYLHDIYLVVNGKVKSRNSKDPLGNIEVTVRLKSAQGNVYYKNTIYTDKKGRYKFTPDEFYLNSICTVKVKDLNGIYMPQRSVFGINRDQFNSGCVTYFNERFLLAFKNQ